MYNRLNGIKSYGKIANFETDPIKQVVMLYDGAIRFLHDAAADIEAGDFAAKGEHSNRALDIINYLQSVLDLDAGGDVGTSLDELYTRVRILILKASVAADADLMRTAAEALRPVRDAWETNAQSRSMAIPPAGMQPAAAAAF
mgnify:CR=1 FL=1